MYIDYTHMLWEQGKETLLSNSAHMYEEMVTNKKSIQFTARNDKGR